MKTLRLVLLVFGFASIAANAMTFTAPKHNPADVITWIDQHGDTTRIYADGEITTSSASELEQFVRANHIESGMVLFNSPGGSLMGGVAVGNTIRKLGFDTGIATYAGGGMVASGICASACAYAFAGGLGRYYSSGNTRLGIHQFYSQGNDIGNGTSQEVSGMLVAYLQRMGVDALAFSASASVQPNDILWLSAAEASRLHFSNNGIEQTTAELKQVKGSTYLRVEQKYTSYTARFIFSCARDGRLLLMGGIVTTPQDAKQKYDWATQSFFTFDEQTIQTKRKGSANDGLAPNDSNIWVTRFLAPAEVQKLLTSKTITTWVAADGAVGSTGAVDISGVRDKIRDFVANCSFYPRVGQ
ncbi:hypothetical protein SAMN05216466_1458 [Paraburkholderia phenazinium]|uniref:Uncharacterized protein n=2 Tax=Paraburkholderia TaxID=1822464 RepID=A0A1G8PDL5_9BURK|nr:hypothetical protein [Paraburkholderia phenazinium]SDI90375.1 hypothetical protein SAMN05216466_1458 [Paraburkholderia phenazinium]